MASDHSNNGSRSSETMTESPDRERVLHDHQNGLELDSRVPNQEVTGSEPIPSSPAQEHLFHRSQEGQESTITTVIHQGLNHDDRRAAAPFPRTPALQPVNMVAEQSLDSIVADVFRRSSSEFDAMSAFQLSDSGGSSRYSYLESSTAQASDSSARDLGSDDGQTRVGAGTEFSWNHSEAAQPVFDQDSRDNAPGTTFRTDFPEKYVLPPLRLGPREIEEERRPRTENTSLPEIFDQWRPRPGKALTAVHLNIHESRRWEVQTVADQGARLVQGPTQQHFGPPMKPFDDAISEAVAQEQWRRVTENERRIARRF